MQGQPTFGSPQVQTPAGPAPIEDRREVAIKRIKRKNAFKTHLLVYVTVNSVLVVLWAVLALGGWSHYVSISLQPHQPLPAGFFWPIFPILGWGIGVVMHANAAYRGDRYTEEQIQREMKNLP